MAGIAPNLLQPLVDAGVIPAGTRRVIVDIAPDSLVTLYIESDIGHKGFDIVRDICKGDVRIVEVSK